MNIDFSLEKAFSENPKLFFYLVNDNEEFYEKIINKNFNNPDKILNYTRKQTSKMRRLRDMNVLLFNHPEFLKA